MNFHQVAVYMFVVLTVIGASMAYVIFILETLPQIITALETVSPSLPFV
jgi:hypothetical protein